MDTMWVQLAHRAPLWMETDFYSCAGTITKIAKLLTTNFCGMLEVQVQSFLLLRSNIVVTLPAAIHTQSLQYSEGYWEVIAQSNFLRWPALISKYMHTHPHRLPGRIGWNADFSEWSRFSHWTAYYLIPLSTSRVTRKLKRFTEKTWNSALPHAKALIFISILSHGCIQIKAICPEHPKWIISENTCQ